MSKKVLCLILLLFAFNVKAVDKDTCDNNELRRLKTMASHLSFTYEFQEASSSFDIIVDNITSEVKPLIIHSWDLLEYDEFVPNNNGTSRLTGFSSGQRVKITVKAYVNNGCVAISGHADSMGAPTACENAGVPFVFYNGSVKEACPNTFIVSTRIDWKPYIAQVIRCLETKTPIPHDWTGTIATGSVVMTEVNEDVAAPGTVEKLNELTAGFISGELEVFDTSKFMVKGENPTSYMADVDSDPAYTPDTEVIIDGVFKESEFRSAPYFAARIDGITELN